MTPHLFVFGRSPGLARTELESQIPAVDSVSPFLAKAALSVPPAEIIGVLGGTVKIARILTTLPRLEAEELAALLVTEEAKKVDFGISFYDTPAVNLLDAVKDALISKGISARFVKTKHEDALSSVVVVKQKLTELVIGPAPEGGYIVAQTVALQDFESWNKRDYDRPAADPKAGMLPPKVARMVVNIALGKEKSGKVLLDPFCGMGTVLSEALLSGAAVIGADISVPAVDGARKNIAWLETVYPHVSASAARLFVSDATHVASQIPAGSVDAIVTEPFMGTTHAGARDAHLSPEKVRNIIKGLEKLYIGCLREWHGILKESGVVLIALPEYHVAGRVHFVKKVIDSCETLGYTCQAGPIEYSRPQAVVRRKFFLFKKL